MGPIRTIELDGKRYMVTLRGSASLSVQRGPALMVEQQVERRAGDPYWRIMWEVPDPVKPRIQRIINAALASNN